jgi:site-specific recombinase XerD
MEATMLSDYVLDRRSQLRLLEVIPGARLDEYVDWLAGLRYSPATIRSYVFAATRFVRWAQENGYGELSALNQSCLIAYRREAIRPSGKSDRRQDSGNQYCGARRFVRFLHNCAGVQDKPHDVQPLVARFCEWMRKQRGTRDSTLATYRHVLCKLVQEFGSAPQRYTAQQLRAFLLKESRGFSSSKADTTATAMRTFVRFLIVDGECAEGLRYAIPRLAKWRQASLPRFVEQEAIERILDACDAHTPVGARDRAMLLLLARLGLRRGDVATLCLQDLDWLKGQVRVRGKSLQFAWLPLPQDAGDSILHYLKVARPKVQSDRVFLINCAPFTPIHPRRVSAAAERAILRSGVTTPSLGAHVFRHSAATAWLRQGLSLQAVGSVLRHRNVDTTTIYAKVDTGLLRQIVLPWPKECTPC